MLDIKAFNLNLTTLAPASGGYALGYDRLIPISLPLLWRIGL